MLNSWRNVKTLSIIRVKNKNGEFNSPVFYQQIALLIFNVLSMEFCQLLASATSTISRLILSKYFFSIIVINSDVQP
jgi:hypothetical protein